MSDIERARQAFELYEVHGCPDQSDILNLVIQGVDVNVTSFLKTTLLHWASDQGHLEVCKQLLQFGANIHARDNNGNTSLHKAAFKGRTKVAKLLVSCGANIWAEEDVEKYTPIFYGETALFQTHRDEWRSKLEAVKDGSHEYVNAPQDLYHLASVMQPVDRRDIPHPKEFIRLLFQQYLPHEPKFNAMYEEIFSQQRVKPLDLQSARKEAAKGREVVL